MKKLKINFKIIICLICIFLASCSNKNMLDYVKGYDQKIEYGDIENYSYLSIDRKIRNVKLDQKLRVGLFLPLSGDAKIIGESLLNSAQLSLFENSKDNVVLKVYDTKGTDFGAVEAMKNAIKDGVDTIIGPLLYAETKAISKLAKDNDIVVFSLSNEQKIKDTNSVFVTGSIIEQEIERLLDYMIALGKVNFIAFLPNNAFGSSVNDILKKKISAKEGFLINTDFYTQETELFETKLLTLLKSYRVSEEFKADYEKQKSEAQLTGRKVEYIVKDEDKIRPDVLLIVDGEKIAQNVGIVMYKHPKIAKDIQLVSTSKIDGGKNITKNPYLENVIFIGSDPDKYKLYEEKYAEIYSLSPLKISTTIYDLVNNIDKFYTKKDGRYLLNKTKLLNPYGYDSIDGKFRFLPNGLIERNYYILQLKEKQKVLVSDSEEFLNY